MAHPCPDRSALLLALMVVGGCVPSPDDSLPAARAPEMARLAPAAEAIAGAYVPTLDPMTMDDAEIDRALGPSPRCTFRYTSAGAPVLAVSPSSAPPSAAAVKLNGHLVMLAPAASQPSELHGIALAAEPVRITVEQDSPRSADATQPSEAAMVFEIGRQLRVGYRGYYGCTSAPAAANSPRR